MRFQLFVLLPAILAGQVSFTRIPDEKLRERLGRIEKSNQQRLEALSRMFEEAGCGGEKLERQKVKGSKLPNLICRLPGESEATVLVGAHFDQVDRAGQGAVDNWSGVAMLPSLYESLSKKPLKLTFLFVGFTDEEVGLVGSRFFVDQLRKEKREMPKAMINIDSVGLTPTKVWVSRSDKKLVDLVYAIAESMRLPLSGVNVDAVGDSDSNEFAVRKVPVLDIHSLTQNTLNILHSTSDQPEAIQFDHYRDTFLLVNGLLAYLDEMQGKAMQSPATK